MDININATKFPLDLKYVDESLDAGKFQVRLLENFIYLSSRGIITVQKGFVCDLASIPQMCQNIICKVGPLDYAAVIHDWLYSKKLYDRKTCDVIFYEALLDCGVSKVQALLMYQAVRLFGGSCY